MVLSVLRIAGCWVTRKKHFILFTFTVNFVTLVKPKRFHKWFIDTKLGKIFRTTVKGNCSKLFLISRHLYSLLERHFNSAKRDINCFKTFSMEPCYPSSPFPFSFSTTNHDWRLRFFTPRRFSCNFQEGFSQLVQSGVSLSDFSYNSIYRINIKAYSELYIFSICGLSKTIEILFLEKCFECDLKLSFTARWIYKKLINFFNCGFQS